MGQGKGNEAVCSVGLGMKEVPSSLTLKYIKKDKVHS